MQKIREFFHLTKQKCNENHTCSRLVYHVSPREIVGALVGMVLILLLVTPVVNAVEQIYERWTPTSSWFEYRALVPVTPEFERGAPIEFYSSVEYKDYMLMQWADYLVCSVDGRNVKLQTQIWPPEGPELKAPGVYNRNEDGDDREAWTYNAEPIPEDARACYLEASAVGYTIKHMQPKTWTWTTDWFPVNQ